MKRIIRYSISIANINRIDLYVVGIEIYSIRLKVHPIYFIYPYLMSYLRQRYLNVSKNIIYIEKIAIS